MRWLLGLLALLTLAAAPARDWTTVATKTPAGAFVIGNPAARVKLVEYASMTCSHCAAFAADSAPVLKERMIRSGQVSLEVRHFVFNSLDLAAVVLARCTGPGRFAATTDFLYATQDQWLGRGQQFQQANTRRLAMYPPLAQLRALADGTGLTQAVVARGLAPAAVDACFDDATEVGRITAMTAHLPTGVHATPTFFVNGQQIAAHAGVEAWAELEPRLRAAGVR